MSQQRVNKARFRYQPGCLGSFDSTEYMLIRQYNFPNIYDSSLDKIISADSDRCSQRDRDHAQRCFKEHIGTGEMDLERWARSAKDEDVITFLKDILKADPKTEWTGYRIMGTVHRSSGYTIWTLSLFSKNPKSDTKVFTGEDAPNVEQKFPSNRSGIW